MNSAQLLAHFDRISDEPDAIPRLRRFILDLAVRGKLVEQDPRDEPASELFKIITKDRESSIMSGELKPISNIPDQAEPQGWDIPYTWVTVPLPKVVYFQEGPGLRNWQFRPSGIPFLNIRTLQDGRVNRHLCQFLDPKEVEQKYRHFLVRDGDIICSTSGTIGKLAVATASDLPLLLNTSIVRFRSYGAHGPSHGFIKLFLGTDSFLRQAMKSVTGAAQVNMGPSHLKLMAFPLPPLAEQHRIVAKVDELMALCDQLAAAQAERESWRDRLVASSLNHLNNGSDADAFCDHARFYFNHLPRLTTRAQHIRQLRQTILNLAIRGKLVSQDPTDEPVASLLMRIDQERTLVAREDRRADEDQAELLATECCWNVPPTWAWRGLADLALFIDYRGKTPTKTYSGIKLITAKNVRRGHINLEPEEFITETTYKAWMTRGFPRNGDILFTTEAPMGNAAVVRRDEKFGLAQRVINFRLYRDLDPDFIVLQLLSAPFQSILDKTATGLTAKGIKAAKLKRLPLAVPPVAEQHRIVAKVEELMALCGRLEAQLTTTQTENGRLLEAVLHEALTPALDKIA